MSDSAAFEQKIDPSAQSSPEHQSCTFICSRDTLDGAYPALVLAVKSRRLGMDAGVFYTSYDRLICNPSRST